MNQMWIAIAILILAACGWMLWMWWGPKVNAITKPEQFEGQSGSAEQKPAEQKPEQKPSSTGIPDDDDNAPIPDEDEAVPVPDYPQYST